MVTNTQYNSWNFLLILFIVSLVVAFGACRDQSALLVTDSSPPIPIERTGLHGEYDLNGLAKRVAQALEKDFILDGISTVYVAQNDSKIIIKGTIPNKTFLNRVVAVARNVRGVSEVDVSQVKVRFELW